MGYIYKITNKLNNHSYIGQTIYPIEHRWKQHLQAASDNVPDRLGAIHKAIQKYGKDNFIVEMVEECANDELNEREIYWIKYYNTYEDGYNLTRGGEGTRQIDYQKVIDLYCNHGLSCTQVAHILNISNHSVGFILKAFDIPLKYNFGDGTECCKKQVSQYKKDGTYIQTFESQTTAAQYIKDSGYSKASVATIGGHIGEVCNGKWKTAYGFKWTH